MSPDFCTNLSAKPMLNIQEINQHTILQTYSAIHIFAILRRSLNGTALYIYNLLSSLKPFMNDRSHHACFFGSDNFRFGSK